MLDELHVFGGDDPTHVQRQCFFLRVAKDAFGRVVDRHVIAVEVVNVNDVVSVFKKLSVTSLAFLQSVTRAFAVSNVLPHYHPGKDLVFFVADGQNAHLKSAFLIVQIENDVLAV